jgi:hypothetical protein
MSRLSLRWFRSLTHGALFSTKPGTEKFGFELKVRVNWGRRDVPFPAGVSSGWFLVRMAALI